ncbi:MFS general substrate transporter [Jaminaea rosea]|uniref:MFS general substrate transporter n=1 Tax=Jaminaea rosea TaxID=1569628 RepID=A0A316UIH4_9BASI|nr:MFS general substrate transporter [Jaminaea rosea]PWN25066.1 MFS general substrate transporter [Jaminaea rosea]
MGPLRRWTASFLTLLALAACLSNGSAFTVAHTLLADEFSIDESTIANTYWPVTTWAIGGALFALVAVPLMEDHGIYWPFLASWVAMIVCIVPQAVARNYATVLVTRFLTGGFVGIIATSSISILTGLWSDERTRGMWVGGYMAAYIIGSSVGPVIGSIVLSTGAGWRAIFWTQAVYLAVLLPFLALLLPQVQAHVEPKSTQTSIPVTVRRAILMLATEPLVLSCTAWTSFLLGTIYLFTQSVEQVYLELYGWDATQAGFVQAATVVGELCSIPFLFLTNSLYWADARRNGRGTPRAEARLHLALPGGLIGVTGGMMVYAFSSYPHVHWMGPTVGLAMVGCGSVIVINCVASYVVDAYADVAGSAMTALALGENSFIAFLPLAAQPMYTRLGLNWASFLLACVSLALSTIPLFVFAKAWKVGPRGYLREVQSRGRTLESRTTTTGSL